MAKGSSGLTTIAAAPPPDLTGDLGPFATYESDSEDSYSLGPTEDERGFEDYDTSDYHDLSDARAYYERQHLTEAEKEASEFYTDPEVESAWENPAADGRHSPSQDLNWAMSQGIPLSAEQERMRDSLLGAMHNTGQNLTLTRYDHAGFVDEILRSQGVFSPDATEMSVSELKSILKGVTYGENKFVSGSYNGFKDALGDGSKWNKKAFMQRYVKVTYQVDANVQSMAPGVSSKTDPYTGKKNDLGEIIMAPSKAGNKNFEILDVKLSGAKAHPKGSLIDSSMTLNQIEIVVRVHKQ